MLQCSVHRLEHVKARCQETSDEFETARRRAKKCKQAFEKVRKERYDRFMSCFDHVSNRIDDIYKVCSTFNLFDKNLYFLLFFD